MIHALSRASLPALQGHLERHLGENVDELFMVPQAREDLLGAFDASAWNCAPQHSPGDWQRVWAFREGRAIRGHVVVTGNRLAPHRCSLGMGVERGFRGAGFGRQLMTTALAWVREQQSIDWVDGVAFAHNAPVLALDYSVGFVKVGRIPDVLRLAGCSIDQIQLVLKVR